MPNANDEIYARQNLIEDLKIPSIASVVGCGGTGFWTALLLAMSGVEEITLFDPDNLDKSNLNRLPFTYSDIGRNKAYLTMCTIRKLRPKIRVEHHDIKIDTEEKCSYLRGYIFCCTDNMKSQQLICAYARKNNLPYQRVGYDGTLLNVSEAFPLSFDENISDGYSQTPSWVAPAVLAASLGVASKLYKPLSIMDDLGKIAIKDKSYIPKHLKDELKENYKNELLEDIENNFYDYFPDYGDCSECDRIDPDNDDYGYCPNCERIDPDNDDYGYCPDCIYQYTEEEMNKKCDESYDEGYQDGYNEAERKFKEEINNLNKVINKLKQTKKEAKNENNKLSKKEHIRN